MHLFIHSKGVDRNLTSELGPVQYIASMYAGLMISASFGKLQSVSGNMHLIQMRKMAITSYDDKTQVLDCNICTRPWGHYNKDMHCSECNIAGI